MENGLLAGACLDALLALLANSPANGRAFLGQHGLVKVCSESHLPPPCDRAAVLAHSVAELPTRCAHCTGGCHRDSTITGGIGSILSMPASDVEQLWAV